MDPECFPKSTKTGEKITSKKYRNFEWFPDAFLTILEMAGPLKLMAGTVLSWVRTYLPKISFRPDFEMILDGFCCYFGWFFGGNVAPENY